MEKLSQNLNLLFEVIDYAGLATLFAFESLNKDLNNRITRDSNLGIVNFRLRENYYENAATYVDAKREI
jgi:CBS domain-containing protein